MHTNKFNWQLASADELIAHLLVCQANTLKQQITYYKSRNNLVMLDRIRLAKLSVQQSKAME